jgi:Ca2+-binding EF-hand superfamily protein
LPLYKVSFDTVAYFRFVLQNLGEEVTDEEAERIIKEQEAKKKGAATATKEDEPMK